MKKCITCKIEKDPSEFNSRKKSKDGLQYECKDCSKKRSKTHYANNREHMLQQIRKSEAIRNFERRRKFYEILKSLKCIDCGETNPATLDFDHKDTHNKLHSVSKMMGDGYSWERIIEEMGKCEVRCANCHRIKTAKTQKWYKDFI